mmetsp:Transcript_44908/g.129760  ORF Transcript_44908/g.129760 Transcript_44908/m.129760 type:complete len:428 (-) Transcript_44908:104-1387(-)
MASSSADPLQRVGLLHDEERLDGDVEAADSPRALVRNGGAGGRLPVRLLVGLASVAVVALVLVVVGPNTLRSSLHAKTSSLGADDGGARFVVLADSQQNPFMGALGAIQGMLTQAEVALHIVGVTSTSTTTTSTTTLTNTTTTRTTTTSSSTTLTTTTWTTTSSTITTTTTRLVSLFCFAVVRAFGYEHELMEALHTKHASIFDCEDTLVFSNGGPLTIGGAPIPEIDIEQIKKGNLSESGTTTNSWLNTMIFMEAWNMVLEDGRWWSHDWTVKVDPDAVFFPQRLKLRLYPYYMAGDYNGPALYVANCDRTWNGQPYELKLFGSMEVISRNAVGMYHAHHQRCENELDWEGWGEDFYMQECFRKLQVGVVNGVDFLADSSCYAAACWDTSKVVYHAFKDVSAWFSCWGTSSVSPPTPIERMVARTR